MKILLVMPDRQTSKRLIQTMTETGHVVTLAQRGFEAVDLLQTGTFGMLMTARNLADFDGIELMRIARKNGTSPYLYITLLADSSDQQDINKALAAGADDYVRLPVDGIELSLRIRNAERIVSTDTRDDALIAMAKLAESRDSHTGRHIERVRLYARELAQAVWEMGSYFGEIDANFVELIYRTAALHDLGKIAIPDAILLKPGKLTELEYGVMKEHTSIGAQTLASVMTPRNACKFLFMGRDIAQSHHERWDGKGYPHQLTETNIPLAARIVSIADVYDALTSIRCYKPAFTHDHALQLIVDGADTQFDPLIVEGFAAIETSVNKIRAREQDPEPLPAQAA